MSVTNSVLERATERLRPRALAGCTVEERSAERHRRVLLTGSAAAIAKLVSVATGLVTIPLTLRYLGLERFGLWMSINSMVAMLAFADLGIGNGLMNAISRAHGQDDTESIRRYVSSSAVMLLLISCIVSGVFAATYPHIPWGRVFNVSSPQAMRDAGPAMAVFFGCFALNIPLGVIQRTQIGLQEGFLNSVWQLLGSAAGLIAVLVVIAMRGGLPWLVLALAGAPVLALAVNGIVYFVKSPVALRPRLDLVSKRAMLEVARIGFLFFVLQMAIAVAYSSDNLIIAHVLGPEAVAQYAVTAKMFSMISLGLSMFLAPLWPAYGEAISRGDGEWVRRTLWRSAALAVTMATLLAAVLVFFGPELLRLWLSKPIAPPLMLLVGLAAWTMMDAAGNSLAMFLNGANIVRMQVVLATIFATGCLILKLVMVRRYGIIGVPWATLFSYTALSAVPCCLLLPRILRRVVPALPSSSSI